MPKVFVQAPQDQVFAAISDFPRHAKWCMHSVVIEAVGKEEAKVGSQYTSLHAKAKAPDQITISALAPNEKISYHVVMPNGWEVENSMSASAQGDGTVVTRKGSFTKLPLMWLPLKLMTPMIGKMTDGKFLKNMKADLEQPSQEAAKTPDSEE